MLYSQRTLSLVQICWEAGNICILPPEARLPTRMLPSNRLSISYCVRAVAYVGRRRGRSKWKRAEKTTSIVLATSFPPLIIWMDTSYCSGENGVTRRRAGSSVHVRFDSFHRQPYRIPVQWSTGGGRSLGILQSRNLAISCMQPAFLSIAPWCQLLLLTRKVYMYGAVTLKSNRPESYVPVLPRGTYVHVVLRHHEKP